MTNCIICGKKLRPFKTTREWKDRDTHLRCNPKRKQKEANRMKYFVFQINNMFGTNYTYDEENDKIIT